MRLPAYAQRTVERIESLAAVWSKHRLGARPAEIAFFGMLSLFPTLIALAAALGFLGKLVGAEAARRAQDQVIAALEDIFTSQAAGTVDAVQALFDRDDSGLLTFATLAAVWSLSRAMVAVMNAMASIYDVADRRPWWKTRMYALLLAFGSVIVLALSLSAFVLGPLLGAGQSIAEHFGLGSTFVDLWTWARFPLAFGLLVGWATVLNHLAPDGKPAWRRNIPGAVVTAALWVTLSFGLRFYVEIASAGNSVFGVLGGALIVLVWLYLLGLAVLIGAEVNVALIQRKVSSPQKTLPYARPL